MIGYQQIQMSILVNSLVFTHNLVQHRKQKCISMAHILLIICFALYYTFYLIISIATDHPSSFVADTYPYFMAVDTMFVLVALLLYVYSICLIKQAIN